MGRDRHSERHGRTVYAPQPKDNAEPPTVISVELDEGEEVEWIWTHTSDGESFVTGYTVIKNAGKPRDGSPSASSTAAEQSVEDLLS